MSSAPLSSLIRRIDDYPKQGIIFHDCNPLLNNADALKRAATIMARPYLSNPPTKILALATRGIVFGTLLSNVLGAGVVVARKKGQHPAPVLASRPYKKEYGDDVIEIQRDLIDSDDRVLIVDDLIALGGTVSAAVQLVRDSGATVHGVSVLIELVELNARQQDALKDVPVHSVLRYDESGSLVACEPDDAPSSAAAAAAADDRKRFMWFTVSGWIGTALFYCMYNMMHLKQSELSPYYTSLVTRTAPAAYHASLRVVEWSSVCWLVSYAASIVWQHALHRYLVFGTHGNYLTSLLWCYVCYSLSIVLSTVVNHVLVSLHIHHQIAFALTLMITGLINYLTLKNAFEPSKGTQTNKQHKS